MSIYLDVSAAVHRRAGLGRYAESLALALLEEIPDRLTLFYNREQGVQPHQRLDSLKYTSVSLGYKPWRMGVWMGQLARIPFNRLVPGATLFHATEHLLMPLKGTPTVMTVHDLIFRQLPEHHKPLNRWYLNGTMPLYCRRASAIIAVSEATRRDLISAYGLPPEKITVIYEAAASHFQPQSEDAQNRARQTYGLPERYILYVGTIEPRKNLERLLQAWAPLYQARACPPLVIVGKRGWLSDGFFAALQVCPAREGVILTGYVQDVDLPSIYSGATVFVFPSLYEGFGLPPLEAMACGAPVICSDASSLPEVVGDAGMLVDPLDVDALQQALGRLSADAELQQTLRAQGLVRSADFSWQRASQETLSLYDAVQRHATG
ncbi:MAG: glycosyltransferase family 4 protein [Anaerolineae bacterium]|nr:glycosyltransferase family 4 protein [Anaerolineae bacterium]